MGIGAGVKAEAVNRRRMANQQKCPYCGFANLTDAAFCGNCGQAMASLPSASDPDLLTAQPCPWCGHGNPPDAAFCGNCGRSFDALPSPSLTTAERGGNRWMLALIILAGLLFLGATAAFLLLPRLNLDWPPVIANSLGEDTPRPVTSEPADTADPTNEPATDEPPTKEVLPTAVPPTEAPPAADPPTATNIPADPPTKAPPAADLPTPTATAPPSPTPTPDVGPERIILGTTGRGTPIEAMRFGNGEAALIFVGGLSAGFAPSTVAIAERVVGHLTANPQLVPGGLTLYIVLSASPDAPVAAGEYRGRLNSNGVDLNRNWDCNWSADTRWQGEIVRGSGGTAPFSEPESQALRDFIFDIQPEGVIFWQARAEGGLVSPGVCGSRINVSASLAGLYGLSAGYRVEDFEDLTNQTLNGDAMNSLDAYGIPAVAVLLPSYNSVDWDNNLNAVLAVLQSYAR